MGGSATMPIAIGTTGSLMGGSATMPIVLVQPGGSILNRVDEEQKWLEEMLLEENDQQQKK